MIQGIVLKPSKGREVNRVFRDILNNNKEHVLNLYSKHSCVETEDDYYALHHELMAFCYKELTETKVTLDPCFIPDHIVHEGKGYSKMATANIDGKNIVFYGNDQEEFLEAFLYLEPGPNFGVHEYIFELKQSPQR